MKLNYVNTLTSLNLTKYTKSLLLIILLCMNNSILFINTSKLTKPGRTNTKNTTTSANPLKIP